eukprot:1147602-Pelagomonas_calceolata.AAC.1
MTRKAEAHLCILHLLFHLEVSEELSKNVAPSCWGCRGQLHLLVLVELKDLISGVLAVRVVHKSEFDLLPHCQRKRAGWVAQMRRRSTPATPCACGEVESGGSYGCVGAASEGHHHHGLQPAAHLLRRHTHGPGSPVTIA